jgi:hypoxanthine phosphoribosyltransferase
MNKTYVAADDLLLDSFKLAVNIVNSGFKPDFLVGLWRGGSAVGIAVQEGLDFLGTKTDHIAIRTSYRGQPGYREMVDKADAIRAHGLRYLHERVCAEHSMLIVDDVYSTGSSVNAVIKQRHPHRDGLVPTHRKNHAGSGFLCARDDRLADPAI